MFAPGPGIQLFAGVQLFELVCSGILELVEQLEQKPSGDEFEKLVTRVDELDEKVNEESESSVYTASEAPS